MSVADHTALGQEAASRGASGPPGAQRRWLVLTHHLPAKPAYLRVKVHRRLERIGAIALKNSVYVLPVTDETLEDFQWLCGEIEAGGGEATLSVAVFIDTDTDARLLRTFGDARAADYRELVSDAERTLDEMRRDDRERTRTPEPVNKLRERLTSVAAIDFFGAPERAEAERAIEAVEAMMEASRRDVPDAPRIVQPGRTWVTREGAKVDRIASAWLIRGFIDPAAAFKFVPARGYVPEEGELRFDMFEGEFTHVGDRCTFETLLAHFEIRDPALEAIAEIVHDIDVKDDRFGRAETAGVASLIRGITRSTSDDSERLGLGRTLLDGLYASLR